MSERKFRLLRAAKEAGLQYFRAGDVPGLLSPAAIDGGLFVLSRYPIVQSVFRPFETTAVQSDLLAHKGFLYVKIDLSSVGGTYLHLYTLHTQASYFEDYSLYAESYLARYRQIQEVKNFMRENLQHVGRADTLMVVGDFN